jgi:hypothetical protein
MRSFLICSIVLALVSFSSFASADTITVPTVSVPIQDTDWSEVLSVPKFDPTLGILQKVSITLAGEVTGSAAYENLDAETQDITLELSATLELQRPDGTKLIDVVPLCNETETASAFDSILDYGGTSGNTFAGLSGTASESGDFMSASDLLLFTGPGNIDLTFSAEASSMGSGGGNLSLLFNTDASGSFDVEYTYVVPEPGTLALLVGLLATLAIWRKR